MKTLRPTALGVDVQGETVRLALVEWTGRQPVARRLVQAALPEGTSEERERLVAAVVARTIREEGLGADVVVMGTPAAGTIVRRLQVPVAGAGKIAAAVTFAMEPLIPYAAEDIYADYLPIEEAGGTDLLAFAAKRETVAQLVKALRQAGVPVNTVAPDLVPLLDTVPHGRPGADEPAAVLYVRGERGFLAVQDGGRVVEFRALRGAADSPPLRRDVLRSLMALQQGGAPLRFITLVGEAAGLADLAAEAGIPAAPAELRPAAAVSDAVAAAVGDWTPWDVALALGTQGVGQITHALNFCRGDLAPARGAAWLAPAKRTAVLAAVTIFVYAVSLTVERWALHRQQDAVRTHIQQQFADSEPGTTSVARARQLVENLSLAHESLAPFIRPGPGVLDVLAACDAAIRDVSKLQVQTLSVSEGVFRMSGHVADFGAVNAVERKLEASPLLTAVRTSRAGDVGKGGTTFRINARVDATGNLTMVKLPEAVAPARRGGATASAPAPFPARVGPDQTPAEPERTAATAQPDAEARPDVPLAEGANTLAPDLEAPGADAEPMTLSPAQTAARPERSVAPRVEDDTDTPAEFGGAAHLFDELLGEVRHDEGGTGDIVWPGEALDGS